MLLDKYTVRIIDGGSCAEPETVELKDGLIGDGVPRLHSQGGYVPVALPSALYAGPVRVRVEELPQEPTVVVEPVDAVVPETSPPVEAVAPVEQPVVSTPVTSAPVCPECPETPALYEARTRGFVGVGAHYIIEGGKAPLAGYGAWLEGRFEVPVSEQNALAFDARHAWISRLAYSENAKNTVLVGDVDFSAGFILPVSRFARLQFGANADVQEAGLEYAGLSAKTGRWAIGPELSLRLKAEKAYAVLHGSFGFGANATSADVEGFVPTNDPLNKAKAGAELAYRPVRAFGVRALAEVEYNSFDATTQDAGLLPQNDTISTVGVRFDLLNWLSVGADFVPYNSQLGNDTESVRIQGGLYHKF
jgi:hypothetical protein